TDEERFMGGRANRSAGMDASLRLSAVESGRYSKVRFHVLDCTERSLGCRLAITDGFDTRALRLDVPALGFDAGPLRFDRPERDLQFVPRNRTWCLRSNFEAVIRRLR